MKEIFKSIKRTPYQSLAGFLVLFFSLFLSLIILFSLSFVNGLLNYLETRPQVTVYFQSKTPENQIFKIRDELSQSGKTLSIKYISQKEAFEIYKNLNKDNPLLLEMVSSDILPPSLEIFAKKPSFLPEIVEYLKKQPDIDEVQFQKDIVDKLLTFTNALRKISFIFFGYLILMSIVVLTTTISFKIALKKDEIELLRLLGATNSYIRKPFLKESLFMGFIASIFSFFVLIFLLFYINPFLNYYLAGIFQISLDFNFLKVVVWPFNFIFFGILFLFVLIFGCLISFLSSYLATNKYLKV
ncbi:MAG: permease-like cell division protein FtsX [Patescibacteria group bacterium]|nr:permease-like cell division protein FtsX [Patescibacteria group bacterium]